MKRDGATISVWQNNMPDYVSQAHDLLMKCMML